VTLRGRAPNREAIGAVVELREHAGEAGTETYDHDAQITRIQRRMVNPTRSYLSQVELPLTFGLGESDVPPTVRVIWPDGSEQIVDLPGVDRTVVVEQVVES
jgi:predicted Zn-dependent protease